jgi:translocation and assembly module TamB
MSRKDNYGEERSNRQHRAWELRLRRFFLLHVPLGIGGIAALVILALVGLYFYASSASFENIVRGRLASSIQQLTGGRVQIDGFHWRLLHLEADVDGLTIHGLESADEAPYVRVEHMHVALSVTGALSPASITHNLLLRDLEIQQPAVHLIVYPDGSTNQPHPLHPQSSDTRNIDRLFDMKASRIAVEQGMIDYENRAADFDFQNRRIPLDFTASNVSLHTSYVPALSGSPESYHIETAANDLNLVRGGRPRAGDKKAIPPVHGRMQATLDLERNKVDLRSLEIGAGGSDGTEHTLHVTGSLVDFSHPHWSATTRGDFDMRLLNPLTGYPFAPEGIAHLDLVSAGNNSEFRVDGSAHIDGGAYIGTGVVARNVTLDCRVHADPQELAITQIIARLHQGGQLEGSILLAHWLPVIVGSASFEAAQPRVLHGQAKQIAPAAKAAEIEQQTILPVDGKVTAKVEGVRLDTILDIVSQQPFQRLGLDAIVNGPASATWSNGDTNTVSVTVNLGLTPSAAPVANEAPVTGAVDGTYTQRDGSVDVRHLEVNLPGSQIAASGKLGAYPMTSPNAISVDFHSQNLSEFDTLLRDLGLQRNGKTGTAALPATLNGQADFHGAWTGSLLRPHIAGDLKATQIALELPGTSGSGAAKPDIIALDSIDATGSYSPARIAVERAVLVRGASRVAISGTLDAAPSAPGHLESGRIDELPEFNEDSVVHARVDAAKIGFDQVQPFLQNKLPVTGFIDAQFRADGALRTVNGSGSIELTNGSIYGEAISRLRAQGSLAAQVLTLATVTGAMDGGTLSGTGTVNLKQHSFQANAKGAGIELSRMGWIAHNGITAAGKLGFTLTGAGSFDDPRVEARADLSSLVLAGQPMGSLEAVAHTANRTAEYDVSSHLDGAEFALHGQTDLGKNYNTNDRVEFSRFNIGALLKLAHFEAVSGASSLAGTITLSGPLAHTGQLRGEASIQELAVTVAGVHLVSAGGAHATLADNRIRLDALHVTGEDTDVNAEATLDLNNGNRLDLTTKGSINLKLAETLDPDLTSSGTTTFQVEAHGPLKNPGLTGRIQVENGSLSLEDLPNGLSQLHGTLEFNQNRLEVRTLTAMTGGGLLTVGGALAYQHGIYADLSVTGQQVRIRYPEGITSLADAKLHLQGTQSNLLLSGDVLITRFSASPDLDLSLLAAAANRSAQAIVAPDAPSNHVRLDVHLASSPQLNFQNAFAKLAGDVDLRVRGTLASPSLLGRVSITDGSAMIAGTRYDLDRGDITFTNPVRIEPTIDLTATARVEDYDVTLGLHGSPEKLAVTYRSDPPLPEADVVALLALGHTASQQRLYTQQQEQQLANPTTDSLLGGALNATVSSRVQKLFGAGSVKVDPNYLGAFGNSTSRITVEEQLGRNVTLTYATDVNTTAQQLLQAEVAINSHVSLVVARDESGVFSMVVKATRRYK